MSNVRRQFKNKINTKQDSIIPLPAVVGNDIGEVKDADGNIYVRIAGQVQKIKSSNVTPLYNQKVWVGYEPTQPNTFKILNERNVSGEPGAIGPAKHGNTHEWMGHGIGGGTDVVKVQLGQFMPLRVMPYEDFKVLIYPGLAWVGSQFVLIADINSSGKPVPKILDLDTHAYTASGKAVYVLITIDTTGTLVSTRGEEKDITTLALTDIPAPPEGTQYVLAAVRFYSGIAEIQENREAVDIVDLRFPMAHSHPSGEITGITWDEVNKTGSDIADLASKSHTSLTDIGTNTHAEIDSSLTKLAANKITAEGDLIYGIAVYSATLNRATVSQGASVTAISTYAGSPGNVIDEDDETIWAGASNPVADDWIRIDLGQERTIAKVRFYQFPYGGAWGATSYKVQGSNNDSSWTDIVTVNPTADDESFNFAAPQTYRYFRFYALSGGEYSWQIYTIELLENEFVEFDLDTLAIGDAGEVLGVASGKPTWGSVPSHTHVEADITDLDHDAAKIDGISVDLTGITDGDALVYDLANTKIKPGVGAGSGDVVGPASSTDGHLAVFDGVDGKKIKDGGAIPTGASLTVEEADGTPTVANVIKIKVTNGTLTDDGSGVVSLDFGSAATDGAAIHDNVDGEINAITEKTTPVANDVILIEDSAASYAKKKVKISNLPTGGSSGDSPPALKIFMNTNFS